MIIREARFIASQTTYTKCPDPVFPEYAFIGRSNVGKSSLINMLTGRKGLAKTSGTPGKTQLINHFMINEAWYLVDLPGYGFARVSKTAKATWDKMIRDYLIKRSNLMTVFILVDIRHEPQKLDLAFIQWVGENNIPLAIAFTKADKLSKQQVVKSVEVYKKELSKEWDELPLLFITSADKRSGRDEILEFLELTNKDFEKPSGLKQKKDS
ncbi:MAG: YihA family ribosome biogenesis GTP-binding protein [Bacteroidetes bacterium]|nr:YihA family ribosome biogenesis GTP-binding protein [Bacteroidota bacterium]MBK9543940.1 YihA family ribosome biogenesis GTP-binding protein [Bacteroidota bacterium]MBL0256587.1 YihA family ribosome biogenesis GTP-binding protein [Bacteroidota bacterium]MBP6401642.1 YihA family ribosome biogenesis GTP-binding protein [Bacteroidia bacterium]MBP6650173.1 YihA family ribosome biogenesis GTP-binding protein [Bacteroidia bacterium]